MLLKSILGFPSVTSSLDTAGMQRALRKEDKHCASTKHGKHKISRAAIGAVKMEGESLLQRLQTVTHGTLWEPLRT